MVTSAYQQFFIFIFFIFVFYKNIFSIWKFTGIYPGYPAGAFVQKFSKQEYTLKLIANLLFQQK